MSRRIIWAGSGCIVGLVLLVGLLFVGVLLVRLLLVIGEVLFACMLLVLCDGFAVSELSTWAGFSLVEFGEDVVASVEQEGVAGVDGGFGLWCADVVSILADESEHEDAFAGEGEFFE